MTLLIKSNGSASPLYPEHAEFFETDLSTGFVNNEWVPASNVSETEESYKIELVAPGMEEDDFTVTINDGILTVTGEREEETEEVIEENYVRREYHCNSFARSFELPADALGEDITAYYEAGILNLYVPKSGIVNKEVREIMVV